jgi:D-alanyl-D-alanine carboxypeptidase (penicillin-binding protein 5/6)
MKRLFALVLTLVAATASFAQMPSPPEVAARNYLLIDVSTGQTLAEREADTPVDPASLTKLMTAYIAFTALRENKLTLDQTLPVSLRAWE